MTKRKRPTAVRSLAKYSFHTLVLAGIYLFYLTLPVSNDTTLKQFEIQKGQSAKSIASNLKSAGLIRSPLYFKILVRIEKLSLQAGIFQIAPSTSPSQIARLLTSAKSIDRKITIPEGYRAEQIAQTANLPTAEFLLAQKGLEGRLFPDTYFLKPDFTAQELVSIMHNNFLAKVGEVDNTTLILASLVERETKGDEEKPIVAGILQKRLASGWPLELDATVQYVLGNSDNWWPNTTLLDRQINSPYNTYLNQGLPPTPIGNPGLASIQAVRNSQASPYWFYLHDRSGTIRYAKTNQEHNQNIAQYIR